MFTPSLTHILGQIPSSCVAPYGYMVTCDQHNVNNLVVGRCVALLWQFYSFTYIFGHIRSIQELSCVIKKYESWKLSFQISNLQWKCKSHKISRRIISFSLDDHIDPPNCVQYCTQNNVYILNTQSNLLVTLVFVGSLLVYKPCHLPLNIGFQLRRRVAIQSPLSMQNVAVGGG